MENEEVISLSYSKPVLKQVVVVNGEYVGFMGTVQKVEPDGMCWIKVLSPKKLCGWSVPIPKKFIRSA